MKISGGESRVPQPMQIGQLARGLGILFAVATMPVLVALGSIKYIESQNDVYGTAGSAHAQKNSTGTQKPEPN